MRLGKQYKKNIEKNKEVYEMLKQYDEQIKK
jgi:hypothetical protein